MPAQISVQLPQDLFTDLHVPPEQFAAEMRLAAAIRWFETGRISQGRGAEIAGLSRAAFIDALAREGVSPIQITAEELRREMEANSCGLQ